MSWRYSLTLRLPILILSMLLSSGLLVTAHATDRSATLSWHGITLYGTVDVGMAHQSHGAPLSRDMYTGLTYLVSSNSHKAVTSVAPNGLSQSKLGLKGELPVGGGLAAVFNFESGFDPPSGRLSDALASLVQNNGRAVPDRTTAADGSRAGQVFNGPAYAGLSSTRLGTLTVGRHNTLVTDAVGLFDPLGASYAFSLLGASGTTAGGGNTQDVRLDDSIKYAYGLGVFHAGALYQAGHGHSSPGRAAQWGIGVKLAGFSMDAVLAYKKQAIAESSLTAAQLATQGVPHDALAATISDNRSRTIVASYQINPGWKLSGGVERITYRNPATALAAGFSGLGGYFVSFVNNSAYAHAKVLDVFWLGATYQLTKQWMLAGAWYHYDQNSYGDTACADRSSNTCSGQLDAYSIVLDYRYTPRFDLYAGVMRSTVEGGQAAGYRYTSNLNTMVGLRFQF